MTGSDRARAQMAGLGMLAGASLYLLMRVLERDYLSDRPALFVATLAAVFFSSLLAMAGPLRIVRAAMGALVLAGVTAALLTLASLRFATVDDLFFDPIAATSAFVLATIPLPFLIAAAGPGWRDYASLFRQAWGIFVRMSVAWVFVGLVWAVIFLSDALLSIVGLTVIERIIEIDIMVWIITGGVLGLGLAVVTELADVVSPYLILRLLRLLLPVVLIVSSVFVLALPVRGMSGLFGGISVALTLLAMAGAAATLITSAVDQSADEATQSPTLSRAAQSMALVLPLVAGLGAFAVWQRVAQHGWTPDRLFAATVAVLALGYGVLYALAVLRRGDWMARIRQANVAMALALVGLAALWLTPLLNPQAISAKSHLARYETGRMSGDAVDVHALGRWGLAGAEALARLEALAGTAGHEALATRLAGGQTTTVPGESREDLLQALTGLLPLQPEGATATRDILLAGLQDYDLRTWRDDCARPLPGPEGGPGCVMVIADLFPLTPGEEALVVLRDDGGYPRLIGLVDEGGSVTQRSVIFLDGRMPDRESLPGLIRQIQAAPPPLSAAPLNQITLPGGGGLVLSP